MVVLLLPQPWLVVSDYLLSTLVSGNFTLSIVMNLHNKLYYKYISQVPSIPQGFKSNFTFHKKLPTNSHLFNQPFSFLLTIQWKDFQEYDLCRSFFSSASHVEVLSNGKWITVNPNFIPTF